MTREEVGEDLSLILYILPFLINGIYCLTIWAPKGLSLSLPADIYLTVTKSPIIFLAGLISTCAAILVEPMSKPVSDREKNLHQAPKRLEIVALASIAFSLIFAWSASDYSTNLRMVISIWLEGRYPLIYPALLLVTALLISPSRAFTSSFRREVFEGLGIVIVLIAPILLYLFWALGSGWNLFLPLGIVLLFVGIYFLATYIRRQESW